MFKILKNNLRDNSYDNHIYFGLTKNQIETLKELLKEDYGCLDIVIDFNDVNKLDNLIKDIPNNLNTNLIKKYIYQYYLYYKILVVVEEDKELKNILFGNSIEDFKNYKFIMFSDVLKKLESVAQNRRIRLHLFLDRVDNKLLQQEINELIYMRIPIAIRGYKTDEKLLSYLTSNGNLIETPHDYSDFHTDEFHQKLKYKTLF